MNDKKLVLHEELQNKREEIHKDIFSSIHELGLKIMKSGTPFSEILENHFDRMTDTFMSLLQSSMIGIVYALEAKDAYSCRHSQRVAIMCGRFADVLKLRPGEKKSVELAASIHDIGKIGIPDSVLLCPNRLNDEQFAYMKTHAQIGADIIQKTLEEQQRLIAAEVLSSPVIMDVTNIIREGILHHHERWDGRGYPGNLKETEIPYISLMIALCDSTDAMLSSRCYRKAFSEDFCKEEIRKNAGIMYSPDLALKFVENWDTIVGDLYKETDVQEVVKI